MIKLILFLIISLIIGLSCNKNTVNRVELTDYKSTVLFIADSQVITKPKFDHLYIKIECGENGNYLSFSNIVSKNNIKSNNIEIEFPIFYYNESTKISPTKLLQKNVIIGFGNIKEIKKGFIIIWENDLSRNNISNQQSKKIGSFTDSILTNLDISSINKLFPEFRGIYRYFKCDTITINTDYGVNTDKFYNNIKFNNKGIWQYNWIPILIPTDIKIQSERYIL